MKQLSLALDDTLFATAERQARKAGKSLPDLVLEFLARLTEKGDDFEILEKEEEALRAKLKQQGRRFAAADRWGRDELHDRHVLRLMAASWS